jgi:hypothetical protein
MMAGSRKHVHLPGDEEDFLFLCIVAHVSQDYYDHGNVTTDFGLLLLRRQEKSRQGRKCLDAGVIGTNRSE